jgi:hypothetical protein
MTTHASILFRCPFCQRGRGDLAINPGKVVVFALDNRQALEVMVQDRPELNLVVHNPESDAQTPCAHLVSYSIRVRLLGTWKRRQRTQGELFLNWRHPSFARNDRDESVIAFLWRHVVLENPQSGLPPRSLHRVAHPDCTLGMESGPGPSAWVLQVNPVIIVAANVREFVEEVREIKRAAA